MKKNTVLEILGIAVIICGITVGVGLLAKGILGDKGQTRTTQSLSTESSMATKTYTQEKTRVEEFDSFKIDIEYADIEVIPSDGYYLEYRIRTNNSEPQSCVKGGTLTMEEGKRPVVSISLDFGDIAEQERSYVKLYVPSDKKFETANLIAESGDISLETVEATSLLVEAAYGDVQLDGFTGDTLAMKMESGELSMGSVDTKKLQVKNEYGKVSAESISCQKGTIENESGEIGIGSAQADELTIQDAYANVTIDELACKDATFALESGELKLDHSKLDHLNVTNSYGDVSLALVDPVSTYSCDMKTEYGTLKVNSKKVEEDEDEVSTYSTSKSGDLSLAITNESGNITVSEIK